jgi:hypothetical protein
LLPPAAAIAAGPGNSLVVTRSGRVLVCGASGSGQCGVAWAEVVCPGFVDVGPEVSWHGLTRPSAAEVEAAGGQVADVLAKVGSCCKQQLCVGCTMPARSVQTARGNH